MLSSVLNRFAIQKKKKKHTEKFLNNGYTTLASAGGLCRFLLELMADGSSQTLVGSVCLLLNLSNSWSVNSSSLLTCPLLGWFSGGSWSGDAQKQLVCEMFVRCIVRPGWNHKCFFSGYSEWPHSKVKCAAGRQRERWDIVYRLKIWTAAHIRRLSLLEGADSVAICCSHEKPQQQQKYSCDKKRKRKKNRLFFSPPHNWLIAGWSRCERRIVGFKVWLKRLHPAHGSYLNPMCGWRVFFFFSYWAGPQAVLML